MNTGDTPAVPSEEEVKDCLAKGHGSLNSYIGCHISRYQRIIAELIKLGKGLSGPTLDVGSGGCALYPLIKKYIPGLLPYTASDITAGTTICDGYNIEIHGFSCEKDRLPLPDQSVGTILFFDVLEHLIEDPMWTLLELNRVLHHGGYVAINTPNANSVDRVFRLLDGIQVATEGFIKPGAIYSRHNKEWNSVEVLWAMRNAGFDSVAIFTTCEHLISEKERQFLELMRSRDWCKLENGYFGPEIFCVLQKTRHCTVDNCNDPDQRWPMWLYSHNDCYRKRPDNWGV